MLEAAYSKYCDGSMRTDSEASLFIKSWMGDQSDPGISAKFIVDVLMRGMQSIPSNHVYRQRCKFCARMVSSIRVEHEAVRDHPAFSAAIYSLNCSHPYLFKEILVRLLLSPYGRGIVNKADLFTQLAVGYDLLKHPKRAEFLLRHVQIMSQTGSVRAITADFALRLLAAICALQAKIVTTLLLNSEAEKYAKMVYDLSPLQVDIAWTLAICETAVSAIHEPPPLLVISVAALEHVAKRRSASDDLTDVDILMHVLDRGRYPHLSALSSMTALRIMREARPPGLDDESLAMTFVNVGNAMLRNTTIASEWNLLARHYFEELIKQVDSGEIHISPDVQYQVALAHAGIGYSYSNIARVDAQDKQRTSYEIAKKHLDRAIELLQLFRQDRWIESRVWAAAGHIEAVFGCIQKMHQRFASALLSGAEHYPINVEDLLHFFTPDYDTRLKFSEALAEIGHTNTAILLAKAAVCSIHHRAAPSEDLTEYASAYISTRTLAHRTLVNELGKVGRYNEGELAYDLLKENEYNEFTQRSNTDAIVTQHIAFTPFEIKAIQQSGLGAAVLEIKRFDQRDAIVNRLANIFSLLHETIQGLIDRQDFSEIQTYSRDGIDPVISLGKNDAILRFITSGSSLSISVFTHLERKQLVVPINVPALGSLIFNFRQQCRSSSSELKSVHTLGNQLYRLLFEAVEQTIPKEISHLYIETDRLIANIPFAALHDGEEYLIQRFSLAYLNRVSLNLNLNINASNTQHAAIFACTNIPGEELPGAAREAEIVSKKLGLQTNLKIDCYINQSCKVDDFLREITRHREGRGLVHLATHASFDPSSDSASSLTFSNKELSVRTLRTVLEKSHCDTGLFVLSACGTARQDIDVEGFSSVLLRSGVRTVLSTLWESFDESAPEFFHNFYSNLNDFSSASSAASAARAAQLILLKPHHDLGSAFMHPAHWVPYIVATARIS